MIKIDMPKINNEVLKKVQKYQLEMLEEFKRICDNNNIDYLLFAGTMLGAERHKGFIPWDDDIDIAMLRKDYEKFLLVAKKELNSKFFLQNYKTDKNFFYNYTRIRYNNTLFIPTHLKHLKMHHGIFIDIFPLDNVKPFTKEGNKQYRKINRLVVMKSSYLPINFKTKNPVKLVWRIFKKIFRIIPLNKYNKMLEQEFRRFQQEDCSHVAELMFQKDILLPRALYNQYEQIVFENEFYKVNKHYKIDLELIFGDYLRLPQYEERKPHHQIETIMFSNDNKGYKY